MFERVRTTPVWTTATWALLLAVCGASAVAGRLCYLGRPFDSDGAMFIYMGRLVADGGGIGRDLVDNKFPTVGLMTSAAWRALGTRWPAYVGLGLVLSVISAMAIGAAAGRGRAAAILFAVVFLNLTPAVFGGFQLETPIVCFTSLAAMGAVRTIDGESASGAFVAGLCAGCAALLKPTGIGVLGAMAIGMIVHRRNVIAIGLSAAAGLAIPLSVAAAYLSVAGLWGELPITAQRLSAYAHGSVFDAVSWIKLAVVVTLIGFPFAIQRVMGRTKPASEVRRRPGSSAYLRRRLGGGHAVLVFAASWLVIELLAVVAQRRMYAYHFLPIVPPAALLFGLLPRQARPLPLLVALGPAAALGFVIALHVIATPTDDRLAVGRYLQARTAPGDRVWADDWPRLLLETDLRPGSRQALTFLFANDDATAGTDSAQIVADLTARRPAYVVLPADLDRWLHRQTNGIVELAQNPTRATAYAAGWRRIERYTVGHYHREATVGDVAVYRLGTDEITADVR